MNLNVYLGLDPGCIETCELFLSSSRDQDMAVGFQNAPFIGFGPWEAHDGPVLLKKCKDTHTHICMKKRMKREEGAWWNIISHLST